MLAEVEEKLSDPKLRTESGCSAHFFPVNEQWGFKAFPRWSFAGEEGKQWVKETRALQKRAHSLGFAPAVGEMVQVKWQDGSLVWGFFTERAVETLLKRHYPNMNENEDFDWDYCTSIPEYVNLKKQMRAAGLSTADMHWTNVAYMADGRLVCIDFS